MGKIKETWSGLQSTFSKVKYICCINLNNDALKTYSDFIFLQLYCE